VTLAAGTRLGPYEIVGSIGAGGMGEVFRARDARLGRNVAVKVLSADLAADPSRLHRFEQEARAVAALSHPNIVAVFDVGQTPVPYLVTELLEGDTLRSLLDRGPMPLRQLIDVALQFTAGLAAAHAGGIVHRDLKPANLFLTRDGVVKILDFGLAKTMNGAMSSVQAEVTAAATLEGTLLGTVGYMAPEQVRGAAVDHRTDIFACGALLYEMMTGQRAFRGESPADTMSAVLREQPPDPVLTAPVPPALLRLVRRCLEKDPDRRFQSVRDVRFAIESISGVGAPATAAPKADKSVAVLPFTNMSADPENEFFSDGLAEELINALARLPGLRVASRTSAFRFRARDVDIRDIARQLNVDTVLEGSVRRIGKRLRITAQLVNAADGYQLWSERYDREMADVFEIQDEITASIVKTLAPALLGQQETAARRHTANPQAYELYLKGRHFWYQRTERTLRAAIECFEGAIDFDPEYALAHAGLADCYSILRIYAFCPASESNARAEAAARTAIRLDPALSESHFALALHTAAHQAGWQDAGPHFARAVALAPQSGTARAYQGFFMGACHQFEEGVPTAEQAVALDSLSPFAHSLAAFTMYDARRAGDAVRMANRALELQPNFTLGLWTLSCASCLLGDYTGAIQALTTLVALPGGSALWKGWLGFAYGRTGRLSEAREVLTTLDNRSGRQYISPLASLLVHFGLDDRDALCASFDAALRDGANGFTLEVLLGPFLDEVSTDPRIAEYMRQLHMIAR